MFCTDPPYGVDYSGKNEFLNKFGKGNHVQKDIENDALDAKESMETLWVPAFSNARACSMENAAYYISSPGGELMLPVMQSIVKSGWQLKHVLIWLKNNIVLGRCDYNYKHEPILYGWNNKHKFYGNGEFTCSVWEIDKPVKNDLHPTMKPIKLIANCLPNSTQENDDVLDVFGGSGSTLIACEQLNRNCYMMELDPHYCDVIVKRWELTTGKKAERLNE